MNRFSICVLAVFSAVLSVSAAPARQMQESTNYYLRISAPEAIGARLETTLIPSRKREVELDRSRIGKNGFSGWVRMPRILANGGKCQRYSGVVFRLMRGGKFVDCATVRMELADSPDGVKLLALPGRNVEGGVITAVIEADAPGAQPRMFWFPDHVNDLEKALDDAGYAELSASDLGGVEINYNFAVKRFRGASTMTRDARTIAQLQRIGRKLGGNSSIFGEKWLSDDTATVGYNFITGGGDKGVYTPLDAEWAAKSRMFWEKYKAKVAKIAPDGKIPDVVKIGDEVGFIRAYTNSPAFRKTFESFRMRLAPELPVDVNMEHIDRKRWVRPVSRTERLARYVTVRALNKETASVFKASTDAAMATLGTGVKTKVNLLGWYYGGGSSACQTWGVTPDYFLLAREGALHYPEIQGMTPYYPPAGPFAMALLTPMFVAQTRELNTRSGGGAMHMMFPCRSEESAYAHVFMSALLNGNTDLSVYTLGFRASGWEWADLPEKWLEVARCTHWMPKVAPYLVGQRRQKADIAVLATESADLWQTNANACAKSEMRGSVYALRFSGYRIDFMREHMVEDGMLDGYRVLWATMPNANRVVQSKLVDWVRAGGTLVLTPGALSRDEADDATLAFDAYRTDALPPDSASEFDCMKMAAAQPPRRTALGKGCVVSFAYMPGMSFCSGTARRKAKYRDETIVQNGLDELNGTVRYGVPYWMDGDEAVRKEIAAVPELAGVRRGIELSSGNVDAGVLDDGERAFVGFANYGSKPIDGLVVSIPLKRRYGQVVTLEDSAVDVKWDGTTAKCAIRLVDAQALLFRP